MKQVASNPLLAELTVVAVAASDEDGSIMTIPTGIVAVGLYSWCIRNEVVSSKSRTQTMS